jgi:hypothetical protein
MVKIIPLAVVVVGLLVAGAIFIANSVKEKKVDLTGVVHAGDPEFDRYRPFLELKDVNIKMGLNFAKKRILMVSGVIVNNGERPVDVVEVKLTFFNYEKPVAEEVKTPYQPGPYTPAIQPLTERAFEFYIEEFPEGWMSSHAELSLSGFRLVPRQ